MTEYTKEDLKSSDWKVRIGAYRKLGFTEEALKDKHRCIRLEAFRKLGWNEEVLEDLILQFVEL